MLAVVLLAGCTGDDETSSNVAQLEEKALLARAIDEMPSVFTVRMNATTTNGTVLTLAATYDKAANWSYIELGGDAQTLAAVGGSAGAGTYLQHGLVIYSGRNGTVYFANGSAFVQPPDAPGTRRVGSLIPLPEHGPLGVLLRADEIVERLADPDARVEQARALQWDGVDAMEIVVSREGVNSTLVVTRVEPPRVVHVATRIAPDERRPASALDDATLEGTLAYEDLLQPRPGAARALSLAYVTKRATGEISWTFVGQGGVRLDELEVQVKRLPDSNTTSGDPGLLPTHWSFAPTSGSRTVGNLTLTYRDADLDGLASKGDSMVATIPGGGLFPPLVLYDLATGTRITPGAGAVFALAALLAAVLLARRG